MILVKIYSLSMFQSMSFICMSLFLGVPITSLIILFVLSFFFLSSGVTWRFQLKLMLWSSDSKTISPLSSLLTLTVLSFLLILKLQGLHLHFIPFGLISISFLSCNFPWQSGQSKVMNLLLNFCSWLRVMVVGSSSLSSKSSGMGCFLNLLLAFAFCFGSMFVYRMFYIINYQFYKFKKYYTQLFDFTVLYHRILIIISNSVFYQVYCIHEKLAFIEF